MLQYPRRVDLLSIERALSKSFIDGDLQSIITILNESVAYRDKLNRFFFFYINLFDEKINDQSISKNDPVKTLYKYKFSTYSDLTRIINLSNYYLQKQQDDL